MRVFWERTDVLGPIYRLAGQGLSDVDVAIKLNLTEVKVVEYLDSVGAAKLLYKGDLSDQLIPTILELAPEHSRPFESKLVPGI